MNKLPEWTGILTDGEPNSINGEPFAIDPVERNMKALFAVDDVIGYPTGRTFLITEVESDLVRMVGPL